MIGYKIFTVLEILKPRILPFCILCLEYRKVLVACFNPTLLNYKPVGHISSSSNTLRIAMTNQKVCHAAIRRSCARTALIVRTGNVIAYSRPEFRYI